MLVISPHSKSSLILSRLAVLAISQIVQPILPGNIVSHQFVRDESRGHQSPLSIFIGEKIQRKSTEISLELIFFVAVEIDFKLFGIGRRTE